MTSVQSRPVNREQVSLLCLDEPAFHFVLHAALPAFELANVLDDDFALVEQVVQVTCALLAYYLAHDIFLLWLVARTPCSHTRLEPTIAQIGEIAFSATIKGLALRSLGGR